MNAASLPAARASAPPPPGLQLRLVRSHGGAKEGLLPVPPAGCGLAQAIEMGGERQSDAQWHRANLCWIAPQGPDWRLVNNNPALVCVLNGERVLAGASRAIAAGDTLEIGLLCFEVESAEAPAGAQEAPVTPLLAHADDGGDGMDGMDGARPSDGAASGAEGSADAFDLRDLAFPSARAAARGAHALENPFGVLGIAGAPTQPTVDPLASLLGEAPPPTWAVGPGPAPQPPDEKPAERVSGLADHDHAPVHPDAQAPGGSRPNSTTRLFESLHEEFTRVVRDPTQLTGSAHWEALLAPGGEQAPSLEDLSAQARPFLLLRDILLPREGIDQVIDDFDPLGRAALLDAPAPQDVLALFAPELARGATAAVPSLTRREHHEMSPDSHMPLRAAPPDPKPD